MLVFKQFNNVKEEYLFHFILYDSYSIYKKPISHSLNENGDGIIIY